MQVRGFKDSDRAELRLLFERAGQGSPTESLWGHADPEAAVYLDPYMELEPESLFVAEKGGELVGYLTGCVNTVAFPSEDTRIAEALRRYRPFRTRQALVFFSRSTVDVLGAAIRRKATAGEFDNSRWPAHLHINVAPEARGTGAAAGMMDRWFDRLLVEQVPGCHLQTLVEMPGRCGFSNEWVLHRTVGLRRCRGSAITAREFTS
ncbi:GNAT family N-acetyltransferase [Nocardia fluminea]|uniref:Acetyltransferase (GNAT) family protein n=1 Tax=Nocardia fluminea TaxID=134984 RepID=A0A2N3V4C3_9NOCA|nr:GNAT family N-acetyltransferase [Nocardia fluminea]PKV76477.1 acetyltransferase (GNAT) family protein [Nocardia fluminea]